MYFPEKDKSGKMTNPKRKYLTSKKYGNYVWKRITLIETDLNNDNCEKGTIELKKNEYGRE